MQASGAGQNPQGMSFRGVQTLRGRCSASLMHLVSVPRVCGFGEYKTQDGRHSTLSQELLSGARVGSLLTPSLRWPVSLQPLHRAHAAYVEVQPPSRSSNLLAQLRDTESWSF
jgi:hypothetical protein